MEIKRVTEKNRLILWGWFSAKYVENMLIPEIEENCIKYGIEYPTAYEIFKNNKFAVNSLYFYHFNAESDIPIGQEYNKIALMKNYEILPESIQTCYSKIICFFSAFRTRPSEHAMRGHHELNLIQFKGDIPQIIYDELFEITELPFDPNEKQICLYSD